MNNNQGFTLIEILVVTTISLLLAGGALAGFLEFNERQQLQTKAKELQTLFRSAQVKARSGEGAGDCRALNPVSQLRGYQVVYSTNSTTATLLRVCKEVASANYTTTAISEVDLTTAPASEAFQLEFLALKGGVIISDDQTISAPTELEISLTGSNNTYDFAVTNTGEITQGAFAVQ